MLVGLTTDSQCPQLVRASLAHGRAEGAGRHRSGAPMNPEIRSDFPVTRELTYLDTAYDGPYPLPVLEEGL